MQFVSSPPGIDLNVASQIPDFKATNKFSISRSKLRQVALGVYACTVLALFWNHAAAKEDGKAICVFVSREPPMGINSLDWRNAVVRACFEWYRCPGVSVSITEDRWRANLVVEVADLSRPATPARRPVLGRCYRNDSAQFPYIPGVDGPPVLIQINQWIRNYPEASLDQTLLHEVGHSVGLDHITQSVMSVGTHRPLALTQEDKRLQMLVMRKLSRIDNVEVPVSYRGLKTTIVSRNGGTKACDSGTIGVRASGIEVARSHE